MSLVKGLMRSFVATAKGRVRRLTRLGKFHTCHSPYNQKVTCVFMMFNRHDLNHASIKELKSILVYPEMLFRLCCLTGHWHKKLTNHIEYNVTWTNGCCVEPVLGT